MNSYLNKKVLLLNSSYEPLTIVNGKKAIIMLVSDKVEYIEQTHISIKSQKISIPLPSIIKLKNYVYIKKRNIALTRKNILKRDKNICQYCGKFDLLLTIDHIIPKNKGGEDTWENLVSACSKCNFKKGDKHLRDINMFLSKKPKKPHYLLYLQDYAKKENHSWKPYLYMV